MAATRTVRLIDNPPHRPYSLGAIAHLMVAVVGDRLEQWLAPTYEPTIVKRNNRYNIPYWEVYDPQTKRTMYCMSEAEVGLWLDRLLCR